MKRNSIFILFFIFIFSTCNGNLSKTYTVYEFSYGEIMGRLGNTGETLFVLSPENDFSVAKINDIKKSGNKYIVEFQLIDYENNSTRNIRRSLKKGDEIKFYGFNIFNSTIESGYVSTYIERLRFGENGRNKNVQIFTITKIDETGFSLGLNIKNIE